MNGNVKTPTSGKDGHVNFSYIGDSNTDPLPRVFSNNDITALLGESHDIFTEMDVLDLATEEWTEHSRWIKYEQNAIEETERWSKPHVSSLSFHSLIELRKCIEFGSVLLDVEDEVLPDILNKMTHQLVHDHQLHEADEGIFKWILQLKHRYFRPESTLHHLAHLRKSGNLERRPTMKRSSRRRSNASPWRRTHSSPGLQSLDDRRKPEATFQKSNTIGHTMNEMGNEEAKPVEHEKHSVVFVDINQNKRTPEERKARALKNWAILRQNLHKVTGHRKLDFSHLVRDIMELNHASKFLRHIPSGAEAGAILVGEADFLEHPVCSFIRLSEGRSMGIQLTEVPLPVRFIFVYLVPEGWGRDVTEVGRTMGTLLSNPRFKHVAYDAKFRQDILDGFDTFMDDSLVLPTGQHYDQGTLLPILHELMKKEKEVAAEITDLSIRRASMAAIKQGVPMADYDGDSQVEGDPLQRTKKLFGGLINEVKFRYPKYCSDIKDAFNSQCLGAIFFIYFAILSPAITFGGLMSDKTERWIGVSETFLISSIGGLIFAVFSSQPLIIIGVTGPILVFEESLYKICDSLDLEYLAVHFWVGIWLAVIATVFVALEGSVLVRYVSRFTQDIFALLISLIFIYESLYKIYVVFRDHPLEEFYFSLLTSPLSTLSTMATPGNTTDLIGNMSTTTELTTTVDTSKEDVVGKPNTALLSLVWCIGTFWLALTLKGFKQSQYLGKMTRRLIGDFSIPIAILIMVVLDVLIKDTYTEKLFVPDGFQPTDASKRGWFVNPLGNNGRELPVWAIPLAIVPAALVFILIFMEAQITSLIVNKNLVKGTGYHLDLNLIGLFGIIAGILGLPLLCGATVRSVTHLNALSVYSTTYAPGEKPKLDFVREQRVTGFCVFLLLGVSILLGPILTYVPLAVLFGVFLYMGVSSLNGIQFWERIRLIFKPVKHHPDVGYVRRVKTYKMHIYTGIQVFILIILWIVKSTQASLAFPFLLILCVPIRNYILPKIYDKNELRMLDADDDKVVEEDPDW